VAEPATGSGRAIVERTHVLMATMSKSERLRLRAGIYVLAERKGVPEAEIRNLPPERIERDFRAARVTTWDIARQVVIARKLEELYVRFGIPESLLLGQAVAQGYLDQKDALTCYAVTSEDIDGVIRENHWTAVA
jgi:hypothetical protein